MNLATLFTLVFIIIIPKTDSHCSTMDWYYTIGTNEIRICENSNKYVVQQHEIWHYHWFMILSDKEREEYRKIWIQSNKKGDWVTEYAKTNVLEDYAETFAYIQKKATGTTPLSRKKIKFISQYIKL